MIEDTIQRIEDRLRGADTIPAERRAELAQLLATLKAEVAALSRTHAEQADSIAGFTDAAAREATRTQPDPQLFQLARAGLDQSVKDFEASHPRLTQTVDALSRALANLGI